MAASEVPTPNPENRKPKTENRNWLWFFVALVLLGAAAVSINWAYNSRRQLTMAELQKNEDLWDKAGPADYDLTIDKTIQSAASGQPIQDRIEVKVRKKKVVDGTINGKPLEKRLWFEYDMDGWFGFVEQFLKIDEAAGAPRTFRAAEFDPATGQLLHFTRSVSTTRERQELTFQLTPVSK